MQRDATERPGSALRHGGRPRAARARARGGDRRRRPFGRPRLGGAARCARRRRARRAATRSSPRTCTTDSRRKPTRGPPFAPDFARNAASTTASAASPSRAGRSKVSRPKRAACGMPRSRPSRAKRMRRSSSSRTIATTRRKPCCCSCCAAPAPTAWPRCRRFARVPSASPGCARCSTSPAATSMPTPRSTRCAGWTTTATPAMRTCATRCAIA